MSEIIFLYTFKSTETRCLQNRTKCGRGELLRLRDSLRTTVNNAVSAPHAHEKKNNKQVLSYFDAIIILDFNEFDVLAQIL